MQAHGSDAAARWQRARSGLQALVRSAKSEWVLAQCAIINDGLASRGSRPAWETVGVLRTGLMGATRRRAPVKMQMPDGTPGVVAREQLYNRAPSGNAAILKLLPQRDVVPGLDGDPSDDDIRTALSKLHETGPGASGLLASVWKALGSTDAGFALVRQMVLHFLEDRAGAARVGDRYTQDPAQEGRSELAGQLPRHHAARGGV